MSDTPIYDQLLAEHRAAAEKAFPLIFVPGQKVEPTLRDRWVAFWCSITPEEARARREEYRRG
jgi:hypothetical protein